MFSGSQQRQGARTHAGEATCCVRLTHAPPRPAPPRPALPRPPSSVCCGDGGEKVNKHTNNKRDEANQLCAAKNIEGTRVFHLTSRLRHPHVYSVRAWPLPHPPPAPSLRQPLHSPAACLVAREARRCRVGSSWPPAEYASHLTINNAVTLGGTHLKPGMPPPAPLLPPSYPLPSLQAPALGFHSAPPCQPHPDLP